MDNIVGVERNSDNRWIIYGDEMRIMGPKEAYEMAPEMILEVMLGEFETFRSNPDHIYLIHSELTTKEILDNLTNREFLFLTWEYTWRENNTIRRSNLHEDLMVLFQTEHLIDEELFRNKCISIWCKYSELLIKDRSDADLKLEFSRLEG